MVNSRGWARVIEGAETVIAVGPLGMKLLNSKDGQLAEIRAVRSLPAGVM